MTQHQKLRHAAAMLIHQLGSGIEALEAVPTDVALENLATLHEDFVKFGQIIAHLQDIQLAKNEQLRTHN